MSGLILPFEGRLPVIAADAFIAPNACVIGKVEIAAGASIWYGAVLRGDIDEIYVGAGTNIQDNAVVHVESRPGGRTWIGAHVTIGHQALIHSCVVEDAAFIGMRAVVMDGAVVESGAFVAAGALVTPGKRVPKGELWAGSPAKYLRHINPAELQHMHDSPRHYAMLAQRHRASLA
jgi:gamma-carbonic anhydrase